MNNDTLQFRQITLKSGKPEEQALLQSLGKYLQQAERSLWEAGRIINELKARYGYTTSELAPMFHQKRARLDEIARTAKDVPPTLRHPELSFSDHLVACRAARRAAIGAKRHTGKYVSPDIPEAIRLAAEKKCGGKNFVREVAKGLIQRRRGEAEAERLAHVQKLAQQNVALLDQMVNKDCRLVIPTIALRSVRVLHLDPPYANYHKSKSGALMQSGATTALDCDNNNREDATSAVVEALQLAVRHDILTPYGVILLWQASNGLLPAFGQAVEDCKLMLHPFIIWDKGRAQMGDPSTPVEYSTEVCYVITRKGQKPVGYGDGPRTQIIRADRCLQRAENYEEIHLMQKPPAVNEEIVRRFTSLGDIIYDAFGCSASMCIAAHSLARKWIYSESNPTNFALGKRNMENFLVASKRACA